MTPAPTPDKPTSARILVVDDSPNVLLASRRTLRHAGHDVVTASTVAEAEAIYDQGDIDLIVLDVNLPDGSGVALSHKWKSDAQDTSVPVILRSATSVSAAEQALGLESGADGYLTEPIEPEVLVATVRAHLRIGELIDELDQNGERSQELVHYALSLAQASRPEDVWKELESSVRNSMGADGAMLVWSTADTSGADRRHVTTELGSQPGPTLVERLIDLARLTPRFFGDADSLDEAVRPYATADGSWAIVPFSDSEMSGVLALEWPHPQVFDSQMRDSLQTFTYLTGISLARTSAVELNRSIAVALQEALTPPLTLLPEVSVIRRSHIADGATLAGGDWFDAFPVGDSQMIVCGDVVGHGAPAAGTSGLFRYSTRTLLFNGVPIDEALVQLDDLLSNYPVQSCGTMVVLDIDPRSRTAEVAGAGHLPPVVVEAGTARTLDYPPGPMLGFGLTETIQRTTFSFGPRTQVVVLTDGVLEEPERSLAESYEDFVAHLDNAQVSDDASLVAAIESFIGGRVLFDDALFAVISLS